MTDFSQSAKLFFAEAGLFKNLAKGSRWQCTRMHCNVSLPSIWMAQNFVALTLSYFYESGANQSCEASRAEYGIGNFDLSEQRLRFDRNASTARALLFDPPLNQFLSGSDGSFDTLAVSG
jgi:hypothetical protein